MERLDMTTLTRVFHHQRGQRPRASGQATSRTGRYLLAGIVAGVLAVAGCGGSGNGHSATPAKVALKLHLTTTSGGGQGTKPLTLTCEPSGGSQPGAHSTCSALLKLKEKNPFAPLAPGKNCPMLLRSNRRILVTGTWFGVTVHRLVLDGGCDIELFDSLTKMMH
jgi:hypothetical protein